MLKQTWPINMQHCGNCYELSSRDLKGPAFIVGNGTQSCRLRALDQIIWRFASEIRCSRSCSRRPPRDQQFIWRSPRPQRAVPCWTSDHSRAASIPSSMWWCRLVYLLTLHQYRTLANRNLSIRWWSLQLGWLFQLRSESEYYGLTDCDYFPRARVFFSWVSPIRYLRSTPQCWWLQ